jgi:hypothetical protein
MELIDGAADVRAAARAGDRGARRALAQRRAELAQQVGVEVDLAAYDLGALGGLRVHPAGHDQADALSSATKS